MENKHLRIALYVDYLDSEYVQKIKSGVEEFLTKKEIECVSFIAGEIGDLNAHNYQSLSVASLINESNFDGIIFVTGTQLHHATVEEIHSYINSFKPIPAVSIGYPFDDIPSIMPDCSNGISLIVNHLIKVHKRSKIALMGVAGNSQEAAERTEVFCKSLEANGIKVDKSLFIYGDFTYMGAMAALENYAAENKIHNFDAIVALNDDMAYACIDFLRSKKIRIPEDVIVTGFDDLTRSIYVSPTLTTVNQNIEKQGGTAAKILCEMINKKSLLMYNTVPTRPVFRQSCGCINKKNNMSKTIDDNGKEIQMSNNIRGVVSEWCEKSNQFVHSINLYSDMQTDMNLDEFRYSIKSHFEAVNILKAAVVLYKTPVSTDRFEYFPMPQEAYLLDAYDSVKGTSVDVSKKPILFNPNECLIPKNIFTDMDKMIIVAMYRNSVQYGYIIFKAGDFDMVVYTMVCRMFTNALASAYDLTCSQNERKKLEKEYSIATRISLTDEMTGLLNRRGFISLGQKTIEVSEAIPQSGLVIYGDMDGLKKINDTYGHAAGDRAIKAEAKLLCTEFRSIDIIGRLGGDEFAIVAPSMTAKRFEFIKKRLYKNCADWNKSSKEEFTLSISLGYAEFSPKNNNYNIKFLLEFADKSLYEEKNRKKSLKNKTDNTASKQHLEKKTSSVKKIAIKKTDKVSSKKLSAKKTGAKKTVPAKTSASKKKATVTK